MTEKAFIHATVEAMNDACKQNFNHSFIDSLVKCKSISKPKAKSEQKKEKRQILKKYRDACNEELLKTTTITI